MDSISQGRQAKRLTHKIYPKTQPVYDIKISSTVQAKMQKMDKKYRKFCIYLSLLEQNIALAVNSHNTSTHFILACVCVCIIVGKCQNMYVKLV